MFLSVSVILCGSTKETLISFVVRFAQETELSHWKKLEGFQFENAAKRITEETIVQRKSVVTKCPKICAKIGHAESILRHLRARRRRRKRGARTFSV